MAEITEAEHEERARWNRQQLKEYFEDRWKRIPRDYTAPPLDDREIAWGVKMGQPLKNRALIASKGKKRL